MNIHNAIRDFVEKYDRTQMEYIEKVSNDFGLNATNAEIKAFNVQECVDNFDSYIRGYATYKIESVNDPKAVDQARIKERFKAFMDSNFFKETRIHYRDIPKFIREYTDGIDKLIHSIDEVCQNMNEANIDSEYIGDVSNFADTFFESLSGYMDKAMDTFLGASGYKSDMAIFGNQKPKPIKESKPVFL